MRGLFTWPSDAKAQAKVLRLIKEEDELPKILFALADRADGLSNAQLDRLLSNNSQWRTASHMRELAALGFVEYQVDLFGGPGRYRLTETGRWVLPSLREGQAPSER